MTYEEAVRYILEHAGPHGLVHECLKEFVEDVEAARGREEPKINFEHIAWCALYEWDI